MSLPKEPRQKMINMMYLVLTALLALNVSSEILNAFKTVNTSIITSNSMLDAKNAVTYKSFDDKIKDPQTKANAEKWKPKADQAKKLSAEMFTYLEGVKLKLKQESELEIKDGIETFNEANLDATTRLMEKQGEGKKIYEKLGAYKREMLSILNPAEFANEPLVQADVKKARAEFEKSLPISLDVPKSQTGASLSNDAAGWTTNFFHMTPSIAGLTILSKFQNDVKNSESQVVDYCHKKIGEVEVVYDQFQALAIANANYVMPGDEIEITAGVGAFSAAAKPTITINGQRITLNAEGSAIFKTKASGSGKRSIPVLIEYTKPDGTIAKVPKTINYEVGMPAGVAVSADKMRVLYVGIANPLTITAGVGSEKISASFSGGKISRKGGAGWEAVPGNNPGVHNVNVTAEGKTTAVPFRVKYLPKPGTFVGASQGGSISAATFKVQGGLIARLVDSEFEAPFRVVGYKLGASGGAFPNYQEATNEGNRWNGGAKNIVDKAGPGTTVYFEDIRVIGPDGRTVTVQPMVFNLK